jgi:predicted phosphodiesterase
VRETERVELGAVRLYAIHDLAQLDIDPAREGVHVVVSGHSHRPSVQTRAGVLYVNPGSAGPRRFTLPVSVGELLVGADGSVSARTIDLAVAGA